MPNTFTVTIELGNANMQTGIDVADMLEEIGCQINTPSKFRIGESGTVKDENGNTVGKWEVK